MILYSSIIHYVYDTCTETLEKGSKSRCIKASIFPFTSTSYRWYEFLRSRILSIMPEYPFDLGHRPHGAAQTLTKSPSRHNIRLGPIGHTDHLYLFTVFYFCCVIFSPIDNRHIHTCNACIVSLFFETNNDPNSIEPWVSIASTAEGYRPDHVANIHYRSHIIRSQTS